MEFTTIVGDFLGIFVPFLIILYPVFTAISSHLPIPWDGIARLLVFAICTGSVFILAGNFFTQIASDSDGLHLIFLWKHLFVPWEDIVDLKPMFNIRIFKGVWVIHTRSLTPFHHLYGLLYSFSLHPSIIFTKSISEYDELHRRIRMSLKIQHKSD